jgi:hypothetical protein
MEDVLDSIRRIIARWTQTTSFLTADADPGDTTVTVRSTRRFRQGDEFMIHNASGATEQRLYVDDVVDDYTLRLTTPLQFSWTVADEATVEKTLYDQYIQEIHLGEPSVINKFPSITVMGTSRSSEWYTIRATKERYNIEIGVFVQDADLDDGYRFLLRMTDTIQKGLKKNIYPLVNDYNSTVPTQDIAVSDLYLKVADSGIFDCGSFILIEDVLNCEANQVNEVVDATTIKVNTPMQHVFDKDFTRVIKPNRYIYNSWPADIQYGKIHKGTLLKAAVINYFVEETEIQGEGGWQDTQLT